MRQHRCCQSSMIRMIVLSHQPGCSRRDSFRNNSRVLQRMNPPPSGGCARLRRRRDGEAVRTAKDDPLLPSWSCCDAPFAARRQLCGTASGGSQTRRFTLQLDAPRSVGSGDAEGKVENAIAGLPWRFVPYSNACPIKPQPQVGSLK
jgi:hypothetical protein